MRPFDTGVDCDHEGTRASAEQRIRSSAVDVLKKHHSKSMTPTVRRLPDPRAMAEIRGGLEGESSEAEKVCTHCVFLYALQLNSAMFSRIAGSQTKYGIIVVIMPSADAVVL